MFYEFIFYCDIKNCNNIIRDTKIWFKANSSNSTAFVVNDMIYSMKDLKFS